MRGRVGADMAGGASRLCSVNAHDGFWGFIVFCGCFAMKRRQAVFMRLAGHYRAVGRIGAGCSGFALFRKSAVLGLGLGFVAVSCFALLCLALSTASSVYAACRPFLPCKAHGGWLWGFALYAAVFAAVWIFQC